MRLQNNSGCLGEGRRIIRDEDDEGLGFGRMLAPRLTHIMSNHDLFFLSPLLNERVTGLISAFS
jgi:hypothetical protein